jgi:transposase
MILNDLQQIVVERQVSSSLLLKQACPDCGQRCCSKGNHTLSLRTVFGQLTVRSPRMHHCGCRPHETKTRANSGGRIYKRNHFVESCQRAAILGELRKASRRGFALHQMAGNVSSTPAGSCPRLLTRRKGPNSTFSRAGSLENKVADEIGFFFELFQKFGSIDVVVSQKHIVGREWRVEGDDGRRGLPL